MRHSRSRVSLALNPGYALRAYVRPCSRLRLLMVLTRATLALTDTASRPKAG